MTVIPLPNIPLDYDSVPPPEDGPEAAEEHFRNYYERQRRFRGGIPPESMATNNKQQDPQKKRKANPQYGRDVDTTKEEQFENENLEEGQEYCPVCKKPNCPGAMDACKHFMGNCWDGDIIWESDLISALQDYRRQSTIL